MNWILQGDPKKFDIDEYLSSSKVIYWTVNRNVDEFTIGDRVYMWRSGKNSGIVGRGYVSEVPKKLEDIKSSENIRDDLWEENIDDGSVYKVQVTLEDFRLDISDGMIPRSSIKDDSRFKNNTIIKVRVGSVHKLTNEESLFIDSLWNDEITPENPSEEYNSIIEGRLRLRSHYYRERNRFIIEKKKTDFKRQNGRLYCEVCSFDFNEKYPKELDTDFIEVHHIIPLSESKEQKKTSLDDLILLCPNCHRMVHRTSEVEENLKILKGHFRNVN